MRMMNRELIGLLSLLLMVVLAGCDSGTVTEAPAETPTPAPAESAPASAPAAGLVGTTWELNGAMLTFTDGSTASLVEAIVGVTVNLDYSLEGGVIELTGMRVIHGGAIDDEELELSYVSQSGTYDGEKLIIDGKAAAKR
jgi:hypothetical protein